MPVFIQISGTLEGNGVFSYVTENGRNALDAGTFNDFEDNIAERLDSNDLFFGVMIDGKVMAGVGMCGILDAYGYLDLRMRFDMEATEGDGGAMFTLSGGSGFDLAVISYSFEAFTGTVGVGTLKDKTDFSWGWEKYEEPSLQSAGGDEILEIKDGQVLKLHHRDMGGGDISSFGAADNDMRLASTLRSVSETVLLDDAPERTSPHIVPLNDDGSKKFMTFIGSGAGRTGARHIYSRNGR